MMTTHELTASSADVEHAPPKLEAEDRDVLLGLAHEAIAAAAAIWSTVPASDPRGSRQPMQPRSFPCA